MNDMPIRFCSLLSREGSPAKKQENVTSNDVRFCSLLSREGSPAEWRQMERITCVSVPYLVGRVLLQVVNTMKTTIMLTFLFPT